MGIPGRMVSDVAWHTQSVLLRRLHSAHGQFSSLHRFKLLLMWREASPGWLKGCCLVKLTLRPTSDSPCYYCVVNTAPSSIFERETNSSCHKSPCVFLNHSLIVKLCVWDRGKTFSLGGMMSWRDDSINTKRLLLLIVPIQHAIKIHASVWNLQKPQ